MAKEPGHGPDPFRPRKRSAQPCGVRRRKFLRNRERVAKELFQFQSRWSDRPLVVQARAAEVRAARCPKWAAKVFEPSGRPGLQPERRFPEAGGRFGPPPVRN